MYSVDELIYQRNADTNALLSVDELVHAAGGLGSSTYSSSIAATTAVSTAVGGIVAGTVNSTLADKTFSQLFDMLLFPTVFPTRNDASVSLASLGSLYIIGSVQNFNITTAVNDGAILLSGAVQNASYVGNPTLAGLTGNIVGSAVNLPVGAVNGVKIVADTSVSNYTIVEGSNTLTLTVTFAAGPMPLDSTGENYPEIQFTGGTRTTTRTVTGVYPLFVGTSAGGKSQLSLVVHTTNNVACAQAYSETTSVRHRLFIPLAMYNLRTWVVQTLNTVSNQYETGNQSIWSITDHTETVEGQSVTYKLYTKTGASSGSNTYRFSF